MLYMVLALSSSSELACIAPGHSLIIFQSCVRPRCGWLGSTSAEVQWSEADVDVCWVWVICRLQPWLVAGGEAPRLGISSCRLFACHASYTAAVWDCLQLGSLPLTMSFNSRASLSFAVGPPVLHL
jgi:hypothetical protein